MRLQEAKTTIQRLIKETTAMSTDVTDKPAKTANQLGKKFLKLSRSLIGGEIKGLDTGEVPILNNLVDTLISGAEQGNIRSVLLQIEKVLGGRLKSVGYTTDAEDAEMEDETI